VGDAHQIRKRSKQHHFFEGDSRGGPRRGPCPRKKEEKDKSVGGENLNRAKCRLLMTQEIRAPVANSGGGAKEGGILSGKRPYNQVE